jgi:2-amino-4-hydroxy-6-hydroxymethyldihydropteridine diphosphokinase
MTAVFIGLGSNLDNPERQVVTAISKLELLPESSLIKCSSLYRSAPMGPQDQPDFINAAIKLETRLTADRLLALTQQIELEHGRIRTVHWGPRTLDLDLLLFGNMIIHTEKLTVPHPHIASRRFVLEPLLEIDPEITIPGLGTGAALYHKLPAGNLEKVTHL